MYDDYESKTTRDRVLQTLLTHEHCTINELAETVGINPISVRHHISRLEAEGLVASVEERQGVGRPRRIYKLTEKGRERFPTRYIQLMMRLLEQLKETVPPQMIDKLFVQIAQDMASNLHDELEGLPLEKRLNMVKQLLSSEGFSVEWVLDGPNVQIRESICPYYHVGQNHPEVCSVDQTLISTLLDTPAMKIKCMLNGDANCTYVITNLNGKMEQQA